MRDITTWISEIRLLHPTQQFTVTINDVQRIDGLFTANAQVDMGLASQVQIGWAQGCNDWPEEGQLWLVEILGFDLPSKIWIARAVIRESD